MSQFINMVSTKRSGHHAFIEWYRAHHPAPTTFINNHSLNAELSTKIASHAKADPSHPLILNYEGAMLSGVQRLITEQTRLSKTVKSIIFLRDPLNLAASLIQRKKSRLANVVMIVRQLLAERHLLLERTASNGLFLHVSYNAWLLDDAYRVNLAKQLGFSSHELSNSITPEGGGSSFGSETELSPRDRSKLVTRWHGYRDDEFFAALISHPVFSAVFEAACSGLYPDSLGSTFSDESAAAYYRRITARRKATPLLDRLIDRLAARPDLFEKMDGAGSGAKKPLILRAYLTALVP